MEVNGKTTTHFSRTRALTLSWFSIPVLLLTWFLTQLSFTGAVITLDLSIHILL